MLVLWELVGWDDSCFSGRCMFASPWVSVWEEEFGCDGECGEDGETVSGRQEHREELMEHSEA